MNRGATMLKASRSNFQPAAAGPRRRFRGSKARNFIWEKSLPESHSLTWQNEGRQHRGNSHVTGVMSFQNQNKKAGTFRLRLD